MARCALVAADIVRVLPIPPPPSQYQRQYSQKKDSLLTFPIIFIQFRTSIFAKKLSIVPVLATNVCMYVSMCVRARSPPCAMGGPIQCSLAPSRKLETKPNQQPTAEKARNWFRHPHTHTYSNHFWGIKSMLHSRLRRIEKLKFPTPKTPQQHPDYIIHTNIYMYT